MLRSLLLGICIPALLFPAYAVQVNGNVTNPSCAQSNGIINVYVTGGQAPYAFSWSDGPVTEDRVDLPPGTYTVTVIDGLSDTDSQTFTLIDQGLQINDAMITYAGGFACPGLSNGHFSVITEALPGVPPYSNTVTVNGSPVAQGADINGWATFYGMATGDQIVWSVTDGTGCSGVWSFIVYGPFGIAATISDITPSCAGNNGSLILHASSSDWPTDLYIYDSGMQLVYSAMAEVFDQNVTGLAPGDYTLLQGWSAYMDQPCPTTIQTPFTIPDLGPDCGTLGGFMWYDVNSNCDNDPGEVPIPYSTLLAQPGDNYVITDGNGLFSYHLVNGNYLLYENDPDLVLNCPAVQPVPFAINTNTVSIDLPNSSTEPLDLVVYAADGLARPGFNYSMWATVRNLTPQTSGPITVTCTFDPALTFVDASPEPISVVGNVITWDVAAFGSFGDADVSVILNVPAATPLGTVLSSTFEAAQPLTESSLANNTYTVMRPVTGSFDPNNKTALTSSRASDTQYFIDGDSYIDYTIRFQNTGTDTAFTVVVLDTIGAELDMASFQQGTASDPFHVAFKPGRVVEWRFDNIDLPDSGTNEVASHGLVHFRIKPMEPLVAGSYILNNADIYFDANPPVITDDVVLVVEMGTGAGEQVLMQQAGTLQLFPNPAQHTIWLKAPDTMQAIDVYAADGRVVMNERVHNDQAQLSVAALPPGSYNAVVRLTNGTILRDRFIKY